MATVECKNCGALLHKMPATAKVIMCHQCICEEVYPQLESPNLQIKQKRQGYPRGWKFKKLFVHVDGTVYHSGVVQPQLANTLPPTPIETVQKKSKHERERDRLALLAELQKLKKQLAKEVRKTFKAKLQSKIKKLQKQL